MTSDFKGGPTAQDYAQLIGTVDMLLESFRQLKADIRGKWYWWSITVWAHGDPLIPGGGSDKEIERADRMWAAFAKQCLRGEYFGLGGGRSEDSREWVQYYATTKGGTTSEYMEIAGAAESAVKSLLIWYPPKYHLKPSEWLNVFHKGKEYYSKYGVSPAGRHVVWSWFEFLFKMAQEVGSPIRVEHIPWLQVGVDLPPLTDPIYQMPPEMAEPRLGPEFRAIKQDICQASILALQFLRQRAEERLRLLGDMSRTPGDSTSWAESKPTKWKPPKNYSGSKSIGIPRSTLEGWEQRDTAPGGELEGKVKKDPITGEKHYPNRWLDRRMKNYRLTCPRENVPVRVRGYPLE